MQSVLRISRGQVVKFKVVLIYAVFINYVGGSPALVGLA